MSQVFVDFFAKTHFMTRLLISVACPIIISRDAWYAGKPMGIIGKYSAAPSMVVIHQSHFAPCNSTDSCSIRMLQLQRYHQRERHWTDFGYNFAIGGDGSVYEGRGWDQIPAAVKSHNEKSLNIVFLGDFLNNEPSTEMITAAKDLIECGVRMGKINQNYKLLGHQQLNPGTACPGKYLFNAIQSWPHWSPMNTSADSSNEETITFLRLQTLSN